MIASSAINDRYKKEGFQVTESVMASVRVRECSNELRKDCAAALSAHPKLVEVGLHKSVSTIDIFWIATAVCDSKSFVMELKKVKDESHHACSSSDNITKSSSASAAGKKIGNSNATTKRLSVLTKTSLLGPPLPTAAAVALNGSRQVNADSTSVATSSSRKRPRGFVEKADESEWLIHPPDGSVRYHCGRVHASVPS